MKKKSLTFLRLSEWILLVLLTGYAVLISIPFSDMFNFDKDIRLAQREGFYFDADAQFQTYFNMSIRLDGVVYDQQEMLVYMTGKHWGPYGKLPNSIRVTTDTGATLESMSGGRTTNIWGSRGYYQFKDIYSGIEWINVHFDAYGESFSFKIILQGGDHA